MKKYGLFLFTALFILGLCIPLNSLSQPVHAENLAQEAKKLEAAEIPGLGPDTEPADDSILSAETAQEGEEPASRPPSVVTIEPPPDYFSISPMPPFVHEISAVMPEGTSMHFSDPTGDEIAAMNAFATQNNVPGSVIGSFILGVVADAEGTPIPANGTVPFNIYVAGIQPGSTITVICINEDGSCGFTPISSVGEGYFTISPSSSPTPFLVFLDVPPADTAQEGNEPVSPPPPPANEPFVSSVIAATPEGTYAKVEHPTSDAIAAMNAFAVQNNVPGSMVDAFFIAGVYTDIENTPVSVNGSIPIDIYIKDVRPGSNITVIYINDDGNCDFMPISSVHEGYFTIQSNVPATFLIILYIPPAQADAPAITPTSPKTGVYL